MLNQEPNLDLIKVLIEARNQKIEIEKNYNSDTYPFKGFKHNQVDPDPCRSLYTDSLETIWYYLN